MIMNDKDFRAALTQLELPVQRRAGAVFVRNVLDLSQDEILGRLVDVTANADYLAEEELAAAYKQAKAVVLESHTRCGADCDWQAQAGYFVARAVAALLAPKRAGKSPAWEAASTARMARTSSLIEAEDSALHNESEVQYRLLDQFLNDI